MTPSSAGQPAAGLAVGSDALAVRIAIAKRIVRWTLPAMLVGWVASIVIMVNTPTPPTRLYASFLWFAALAASAYFAWGKNWLRAAAALCVGLALVTGTSTLLHSVHSFGFTGNMVLMALVVPLFGVRWGLCLGAWALLSGGVWMWLHARGLTTGVRYASDIQAYLFITVLLMMVLAVITAPTRMLAQALADAQERLRALSVARDEERRASEALRAASERLAHAARFEALGKLSGGVAHDFNNMLSAIMAATDLLATSKQGADPDFQANIDTVREASRRAAELTRKLLAFGRQDRIDSHSIHLNVLITEVASLARTSFAGRVKVVLNLPTEPLIVEGDRAALEHALLNLLFNARDAMPQGGEITVTAQARTLETHFCETIGFDMKPGAAAHITIRDHGVGMAEDVVARIFEPFYTTKPRGSGTGLGLSAVHGTVVGHHGAIAVESHVAVGSTFHIYLPLLPQPSARTTPESTTGAASPSANTDA